MDEINKVLASETGIDVGKLLLFIIGIIGFLGISVWFLSCMYTVDYYEKQELVAFINSNSIENDEKLSYVVIDNAQASFIVKEGDEIIPYKVSKDNCSFFETENTSYIKIGMNELTKQKLKYKIYLSHGSANIRYKLE